MDQWLTNCAFHEMNLKDMKQLQRKCYQMLITMQLPTRKPVSMKVPNDGDVPKVYPNSRDKFPVSTFGTIIVKIETEKRR